MPHYAVNLNGNPLSPWGFFGDFNGSNRADFPNYRLDRATRLSSFASPSQQRNFVRVLAQCDGDYVNVWLNLSPAAFVGAGHRSLAPVRAKRVGDRCRWRRMAAVAFVGEVGVSENHVRQPGSTKIPEEPPLGEKRELAGREGCASKRLSQNNTMLNTTLRRPSGSHDSPPSQREGRLISRFNLGALLLSIPASRADDSLAGATCLYC